MLDIDHFKLVNDTYGHAMGDRVIQAIAHVLRQRLRKSDKIGRYGGEEFAIALPGCDSDLAYTILEDIRERFAALHFTHLGKPFQCTLSAGIACSQHHPGVDSNQLLNLADQALYKAKRANRNQVQIMHGNNSRNRNRKINNNNNNRIDEAFVCDTETHTKVRQSHSASFDSL